jgi:hypothetical protein
VRGICKQKWNMMIPLFYFTLACGFLEWPWRTTHSEGVIVLFSHLARLNGKLMKGQLSQCCFANRQQNTRIKSHRRTIVHCDTTVLVYSSRTYFWISCLMPLTASETTQHRLVKLLANNGLKNIWKLFCPNLRLYPGINLDSMKETVKNLRQESRCLQNDVNQTTGIYQQQSSPLHSTFLVSTIINVHVCGLRTSTRTGVVKLTILNLPWWRTNPFQARLLLLGCITPAIPLSEASPTFCFVGL